MKLAADVVVPKRAIELLQQAGHQVVAVAGTGESDRQWVARARAESAMLILSADKRLKTAIPVVWPPQHLGGDDLTEWCLWAADVVDRAHGAPEAVAEINRISSALYGPLVPEPYTPLAALPEPGRSNPVREAWLENGGAYAL